ncbi:MAG: hypothetical protein C0597_03045, partial [Marinilabiliales bacterium]
MKRFKYLSLLFVLISIELLAQVPGNFNYQAVIRNDAGDLLINQSISVRISIFDNLPTGSVLYEEVHSVSTNAFGIVNIVVGNGTVETGNFNEITWGENHKFLGVEVDEGNGYIDMGTVQLLSVPYSLYAEISDSSILAAMAHTATTADVAISSNNAEIANFADSSRVAGMAYTANTADLLGSNGVYSTTTDTLFVVKDHDGNVVFAVFPDGAEVIVNETAKGKVGGFAVSGR